MIKKLFAMIIATIMSISLFSACHRDKDKIIIDTNKTTLFVGAYSGAFGRGYALETISRFEEAYKDVSFENNKKGVQVIPYTSENYTGTGLTGQTQNNTQDVYLTEQVYYYDMVKGGNGDMLEITDLVTSSMQYNFATKKIDSEKENKTLEQKMRPGYIDYLNVGSETAKEYYAVPLYESYYNIIYDVNLFDINNYYFSDTISNNFISPTNLTKSAGPNGKLGDFDDGLPAIYSQFEALCKRMLGNGIAPMVYAGRYPGYVNHVLTNAWADYEGKEQMMLNYTFEGTAVNIIDSFDSSGNPVIKSETISPSKGWVTHQKQAGKYYALTFAESLAKGRYIGKSYFLDGISTYGQYDAQRAFVSNKFNDTTDVAMLMDGVWWEYEARNDINAVMEKNHLTRDDIKYAVMPLPKSDTSRLGKATNVDVNYSLAFIPRTISADKIPLAKAFLQFLATENSLKEYLLEFGVFPAYEMDLNQDSEYFKTLSYYTQSLYEMRINSDLILPMDNNETYKSLGLSISPFENAWSRQDPITLLSARNTSDTAKKLFEALNYSSLFSNIG